MSLLFDAFWRAVAYCLHPRVILLSLLPLIIMVVLALALGHFYWHPSVEWVRLTLDEYEWAARLWGWLDSLGVGQLRAALAPLIVIFAVTPLIVVLSLLLVAVLMMPALVRMVATRRFPELERRHGGSVLVSVLWSLGSTLLALIAIVISLPLWLIPPLILILPPLIWGWLTYRVMAFDALAEHASKAERQQLMREHKGWLLGMGVLTGYLGAAPSVVWASGALFAAAFVILAPIAIWIYTLVFAFSSLWFSHYCLAALQKMRAAQEGNDPASGAASQPLALQDESNADRPALAAPAPTTSP
ncbi:MAG: EI24 domain-containing protein [Burkholderiaceae bacterium]|nr:EI24 domain-containing protein [Burkholderiaceae bacterium]